VSGPLPLPDPPLGDGVVVLRPWERADAAVLAAAWHDPAIARWSGIPPDSSEEYAARWIDGEEARREAGLALDLVIAGAGEASAEVLGEAGFVVANADLAVFGWWVGATHRRRGVATRGVALLAAWCRDELGLTTVADVDASNVASLAVAARSGIAIRRSTR
jgi:RimJ/RimL family protein N-acetyltransferase